MAMAIGGWIGRSGVMKKRRNGGGARCAAMAAGSLAEQYRTLRIQPGASEKEVKKAFRQLALQYHPDVCKGSNCGVQFHRINEAHDIVMSSLRRSEEEQDQWKFQEWSNGNSGVDESTREMYDQSWDLWEEWMGWEGAGIRDYSSHINPYI
ncbi:chaperone protein dnaJ 8, chloroplastic [Canna indica]|uniref:Chaperone protein dnaJ 8, chloroplastic n=1 Tax=Canna indica TaxID=4628 RepID=A0AAQ3KBR2_9LILI|nr:chaperone protein dnaJ 8, chloroplastic [Canna indica]